MNITDEAVSILTPDEMRGARRLVGLNLATLSRYAGVSVTQLSQFENGLNGLSADQLRSCKQILLGVAVERVEGIQNFIAREKEKAAQMAAVRQAASETIPLS